MNDKKTLEFDWELGHEKLMLEVNSYACNGRLYIGLIQINEGEEELFSDLTINLADMPAEINEAYIDEFSIKNKLEFIKKHNLGVVLTAKGYSGMGRYYKVAFDLDRLAEFDKDGVEKYRHIHGLCANNPQS